MSMNAKAVVTVTFTFTDGEERDYPITANIGIATDLAKQAAQNGVIALWNAEESYGIPMAHVRDWTVRELTEDEEREYNDAPALLEAVG